MLIASLFATGMASAAEVTKEFTRAATTEVSIEGDFRVVMSDQYRNNIKIVYDEAIAKYISTEIKGKQLNISYARGAKKMLRTTNAVPPTIYIDRNFASYTFAGGVNATSTELIEGSELVFRLEDASTLDARISTGKLTMKISDTSGYKGEITAREALFVLNNSASASVCGMANKLTVSASSNAIFNGDGLDNQIGASVSVSGTSNVNFVGKGAVKVSASGSTNVIAAVQARTLAVSASGTSSVTLGGSAKSLTLTAGGTSRIAIAEFAAESAKITAKGTSTVGVASNGAMKITASDTAVVDVDCKTNLSVKASKSATVTHNPEARLIKITLKDQATVKAREDKQQAVNIFATPQSYGSSSRSSSFNF